METLKADKVGPEEYNIGVFFPIFTYNQLSSSSLEIVHPPKRKPRKRRRSK